MSQTKDVPEYEQEYKLSLPNNLSHSGIIGLSFVVGLIHTFIVEIPHFWRKTPTKNIYHELMEEKACKLQTH